MKFLIDTNILIYIENNRIVETDFSELYKLAISNNCKVQYHPAAIPENVSKNKDINRRNIILSKLAKYERMKKTGVPTKAFLEKVSNTKKYDQLDNLQLYQIYNNDTDYFITQDKGIINKAKILSLDERILSIKQAIELVESQAVIRIPKYQSLKEHSMRDIEQYFKSKFFDSFRENHGKDRFDKWLSKCAKKDRKCYSLTVADQLQAILTYCKEAPIYHQIPIIQGVALRICTLKFTSSAFGIKIGELFINKTIEYCLKCKIKYLYLAVYDNQDLLIHLLTKFGFESHEIINSQGILENLMIKTLDKSQIKETTNLISDHPFYSDSTNIAKYVISIQPQFYITLFKDGSLRVPSLFNDLDFSINEIQGNTLIKAHISGSKNKKLNKGDILFFYASQNYKVIEPIGILESLHVVDNYEELWSLVKKKTTLKQDYLRDLLQQKGKLHVIIFRLITYMDHVISHQRIKAIDDFKNRIKPITRLKENDYLRLKEENYFNEHYIIN